ncbi:MAG: ComEC/Rec2 family competence protein [Verrucomicrobium sp.]|nr:ComEC/Rec2 family competence protein [Verrucomicrobium sp.]
MEKRVEPARAPLFLPALSLGLGCWAGGFFSLPLVPLGGAAVAGLLLWACLRRACALLALCLFCAAAGGLFLRLPQLHPDPRDLAALPQAKFDNPTWEGRIVSVPEFYPGRGRNAGGGQARFIVAAERWRTAGEWSSCQGRFQAEIKGTDSDWRAGQHVRLAGPLALPPLPDAPGRFNAREFLAHRGVGYRVVVAGRDAERLDAGGGMLAAFGRGAAALRAWGVEKLSKGLEGDPLAAQVLAGIVLGQRHLVPAETLFSFRDTGAYHLFSANGGDVALLMAAALAALRLCGLIRWRWGWLAAPVLLFYALVAGSQPSVMRGLTAATVVLAAWLVGRPIPALHLWSLTLLAVLALAPQAALDLGFQFSFLVVLSMILLTPRLARAFSRPGALDPFIPLRLATPAQKARHQANRFASRLLAACTAAWIGAFGLELAYFHQICLTTVPANFVGVPLTGLIFTVGLLTLAGAVWTPWAVLLNNANWLFVKLLMGVVLLLSHIPHSSVYVAPGYYAAGPDPEITLATAGRGTMILLRHGGKAWLVNPGNAYAFFHEVDPVRKYLGVNRLAGFGATEWSAAEAGAAPLLPGLLPCGPAFAPPPGRLSHAGPWAAAWMDSQAAPQAWRAGDRIDLGGGLAVEVLSPDAEATAARLAADRALVLRFDYRGARFLYAGHVGFGIEERVARATPDLGSAVLAQGKHPSEANLTPEWLERIAPVNVVLLGAARTPEDLRSAVWNLEESGALRITLRADGRVDVVPWR